MSLYSLVQPSQARVLLHSFISHLCEKVQAVQDCWLHALFLICWPPISATRVVGEEPTRTFSPGEARTERNRSVQSPPRLHSLPITLHAIACETKKKEKKTNNQ